MLTYSLLTLLLIVSAYLTIYKGYLFGFAFSLIPLALIVFIKFIDNPIWTFMILFITNYYISGFSRYIQGISPGLFMDGLLVLSLVIMLIQIMRKDSEVKLKNIFNPLTFVSFTWMLYCTLELINPNSSGSLAWFTNVRGIAFYFFAITILSSAFLTKYKHLSTFLVVWAILSLTAVLKALMQKYIGFDFAETRWLNAGGSSTHIIHSGIRYFSFFTDAANFGSGISFSMVVFGLSSIYIKNLRLKILFFVTAIACAYGMIISGTRGSMAVPFVALAAMTVISKKFKIMIFTGILLITAYGFLKYTNYGQGNTYIRRMRSAFNTEDASLKVRVENRKKLAAYMEHLPFGGGIGMSRSENVSYKPDEFISSIPTDGWYVLIWIETGIVGSVIYISILGFILIYGSVLVMFKLKNNELRGIVASMVSGIAGIYASAYSIEILGQFPNAFIIFICMAFIFLSPKYDKELNEGTV
jgi:hypothetical protein